MSIKKLISKAQSGIQFPVILQPAVADNTRYVRPYNSIEIAESKKAYEQEQLQKLIEAAQKRLPLLKADTRSTTQRQRDHNRAIQLEVKQKANELAAIFGRALGANHDMAVDEVNQNTLNTINLMGYIAVPYLMTTLESGYYLGTGRPKEAALTAGVGYGLPQIPKITNLKRISLKLPNRPTRIVNLNAINDAEITGIIRGNPNNLNSTDVSATWFSENKPIVTPRKGDYIIIPKKEHSPIFILESTINPFKTNSKELNLVGNRFAKDFEYFTPFGFKNHPLFYLKNQFNINPTLKFYNIDLLNKVLSENENSFIHGDFTTSGWNGGKGAYIFNGKLWPSLGENSFSWWNKGKPYSTGVGSRKFSRFISIPELLSLMKVRDLPFKVGQWDPSNKRSFITQLEYVTDLPIDLKNAKIYELISPSGQYIQVH